MNIQTYVVEMANALKKQKDLNAQVEREWWTDCLWQIVATPKSFTVRSYTTNGGPRSYDAPAPHEWLEGKRLEATAYYLRLWRKWREGELSELPPSNTRPDIHYRNFMHMGSPIGCMVDLDCYYDETREKHEGSGNRQVVCAFNKDRPAHPGSEE